MSNEGIKNVLISTKAKMLRRVEGAKVATPTVEGAAKNSNPNNKVGINKG